MAYKRRRVDYDPNDKKSSPKRRRHNVYAGDWRSTNEEHYRNDSEHAIDTNYPDSHTDEGHFRYQLGESIGLQLSPSEPTRRRYKLLAKMGQGTFGRVFLCWDREKACYVAVKVVRAIRKYTESAMTEIDILHRIQNYSLKCGYECTSPNQNNKDTKEWVQQSSEDLNWKVIPLQIEHYDQNFVPPDNQHCIKLLSWFKFHAHVCMVFDNCGLSLYDFLKKNEYRPFEMYLIRDMAYQLFQTLHFLHTKIHLIHTDLKPENILFASSETLTVANPDYCDERQDNSEPEYSIRVVRARSAGELPFLRPQSTQIKVIDLGSAVFLEEDRLKTSVVCTRHYRAPEVILRTGWSFPVDIWSAGTILLELYTGDTIFQTHNNLEHLAMMEKCFGNFPSELLVSKSKEVEKMENGENDSRDSGKKSHKREERSCKNYSESDSDDYNSDYRKPTVDKYFSFIKQTVTTTASTTAASTTAASTTATSTTTTTTTNTITTTTTTSCTTTTTTTTTTNNIISSTTNPTCPSPPIISTPSEASKSTTTSDDTSNSLTQTLKKPTTPVTKTYYKPRLKYPREDTSTRSQARVKEIVPLRQLICERHADFYDFIRKCLNYDPQKRMTAQEALQHPFLNKKRKNE